MSKLSSEMNYHAYICVLFLLAHHFPEQVFVVLVNFCEHNSNGHIILPSALNKLKGKTCVMTDYMSNTVWEKVRFRVNNRAYVCMCFLCVCTRSRVLFCFVRMTGLCIPFTIGAAGRDVCLIKYGMCAMTEYLSESIPSNMLLSVGTGAQGRLPAHA